MRFAWRPILGVIFSLALVAGSACGGPHSNSTASRSRTVLKSPVTPSSGVNLDPQVAMPSGFPSDVPIYPGARLTSQNNFSSNGTTTWGMEWETAGGVDKVQAFYTAKLNSGDWTLSFSGNNNGLFTAVFNRKSDSKVAGILGLDGSAGFTKISLALTNAG